MFELVLYTSKQCKYCQAIKPIYQSLWGDKVKEYDVVEKGYPIGINATPTLVLYDSKGIEKGRIVGATPKKSVLGGFVQLVNLQAR